MEDLVAWIESVFDDCAARAPHGIGWDLDRAEPPVTARITPADGPTGHVVLRHDDVLERINFVARLQAFLDVELDTPVPACPRHHIGLEPIRVRDAVHWRCPGGDFTCPVGDYMEGWWPPELDADPQGIAPRLSRRFTRRGLTGIASIWVESRDGGLVAHVTLRPTADEAAVREAAEPLPLEAEHVEAVRTVRLERPATDTERPHRALTRVGAPMTLAALTGRLRRAEPGDAWDFFVANTPVRLVPEHRRGSPGEAVVLDASGGPFADEGDEVCCVGGFGRTGPVRGETAIFYAGELRVYETGPTSASPSAVRA